MHWVLFEEVSAVRLAAGSCCVSSGQDDVWFLSTPCSDLFSQSHAANGVLHASDCIRFNLGTT